MINIDQTASHIAVHMSLVPCGLPPIAPGLTGAGLSPRFGPHLPFDGRQRGSMQTERDRYRGGQHTTGWVRRSRTSVDGWRWHMNRFAVIHDGERDILMEDIKIDELNVILKEALKAVGFGTATVGAQRYNDDAIPSNWDRSDMITYGNEDPDEVEAVLSRIIPDLQVKYRI